METLPLELATNILLFLGNLNDILVLVKNNKLFYESFTRDNKYILQEFLENNYSMKIPLNESIETHKEFTRLEKLVKYDDEDLNLIIEKIIDF